MTWDSEAERAERYRTASYFLAHLSADWAFLVVLTGPCHHDPKAAREPYEALVRVIAYQQFHAKAGDAILIRHSGEWLICKTDAEKALAVETETARNRLSGSRRAADFDPASL